MFEKAAGVGALPGSAFSGVSEPWIPTFMLVYGGSETSWLRVTGVRSEK